ncbi:uncharacterized protein LOC135367935 isoform X2 [Ornithodoros turicata]
MAVLQNVAEVHQVLQGRLSQTERLIKDILNCRKSVKENSAVVKEQIHSAFSDAVCSLEQRKLQLSRQVDVLVSHQENRLHVDLAKLYQCQGQLRSLMKLLEDRQLRFDLDIYRIPEIPSVGTKVHELKFNCIEDQLLRYGTNALGHIEVNGRLPSLDLEEEDYGDLSHHILHKDLSAEDIQKSSMCDPWLLYHTSDYTSDEGFEVVGACLPKSLSATSSSIEAVSMDEDDGSEKHAKSLVKPYDSPSEGVSKDLPMTSPHFNEDTSFWLLHSSTNCPAAPSGPRVNRISKEDSLCDKDSSLYLLHSSLRDLSLKESDSCISIVSDSTNSDELSWLLASKSGSLYASSGCSTVCSETANQDITGADASQDDRKWLLATRSSRTGTDYYSMKVREMFSAYFDHADYTSWIMNGKRTA